MSKKEKVVYKEKINWKKEAALLPGYLIVLIWIAFTAVFLIDLSRQPFYGTGDILGRSVQICDGIPF